ncbi:pyrroloquinoline quinone precursor peptide PqqA [Streptomyces sp. NPDC047315]
MNPTAATTEDPRAAATTATTTDADDWRSPGYEVVDTALEVTAYLHADR